MRKKAKPRGDPTKIQPFQWQPGQSGNPKGRPKKRRLDDILSDVLGERVPKELDGRQRTLGEMLLRNWVIEGIKTKDTQIIMAIFNLVDKVKNRIESDGEDGEPIPVTRSDLQRLTDEELDELAKLIRKATDPK